MKYVTRKVDLPIFSLISHVIHINFSCQLFSLENSYFCETFMDGLREGERYIEIQKPRDYMYILIYGFSTAKPCARAFRDMHLV